MSDLKPLAKVRDMTGKVIRLGMFETIIGLKVEGTSLTLGINRAQVRETRGEYRIVKRGMTLHVWNLTPEGWVACEPFTQWWSTDETVRRLPVRA